VAERREFRSCHHPKTGLSRCLAARCRLALAEKNHHDMGWTRCSSRAAGGWADGVRDRAGSGVDVRSCCERCHEVKACMRHGARHSGVQCAGRTMKLELAPPCAAREFIPLRTNALIEIGKPGTCFEDRCERRLPGRSSDPAADTSREPLFETRTTHC
jgi:hypothetical protein